MMAIMKDFNPSVDSWGFQNWGETGDFCIGSCEFSWDLFRQTYMGINPSEDPVAAPLDYAFYQIFKKCAEQGNCGGLSLLALALFKFGGYMGFCSPASFYTGTKKPPDWRGTDRDDLHRAINILQARQFSAHGIENFLDVVGAGQLNNADAAFDKAKELLGNGDYPLLSIARDALGDAAHTVIPYKVDDNPPGYPAGTRIMHIWDSNHPYAADPPHYQGSGPGAAHHMVIRSATDWQYTSGSKSYPGSTTGWCFIVPMSAVLNKARHPMAPDMVFDALMSAFVTGPGAAVDQVTDEEGHKLYTFTGEHTLRSELETDPALRLDGIGRWPWLAQNEEGELPGELYFMRRRLGERNLEFTVRGSQYRVIAGIAGNLLEVEVSSSRRSQDVLRISRLSTATRSIEIQPLDRTRAVQVRYLRSDTSGNEWRSVEVRTARLGRGGLTLSLPGDMDAVELHSRGGAVPFDLALAQRREGQVQRREAGRLSTVRGNAFRVEPDDWYYLDKSEIRSSARKFEAS
jgi:hypothetical protein